MKVGDLVRLNQEQYPSAATGILVKKLLSYPGVRTTYLVLVGDNCYKLCGSTLEVISESR